MSSSQRRLGYFTYICSAFPPYGRHWHLFSCAGRVVKGYLAMGAVLLIPILHHHDQDDA